MIGGGVHDDVHSDGVQPGGHLTEWLNTPPCPAGSTM